MTKTLKALDKFVDIVLAYRPKSATPKKAKKRANKGSKKP